MRNNVNENNRIDAFTNVEYRRYQGSTVEKMLDPFTIYVDKSGNGYIQIVYYLCPCGCDKEIAIPTCMGEKTTEHWLVSVDNNTVTLHPSIHMVPGTCQSHYFIKNNKIQWV